MYVCMNVCSVCMYVSHMYIHQISCVSVFVRVYVCTCIIYVRMYVYMYVCRCMYISLSNILCECVCMCICVYMYCYEYILHAYIHTHTHIHTHVYEQYLYICVCIYIYIHTHTYAHRSIRKRAQANTWMHAYIHAYIHTYRGFYFDWGSIVQGLRHLTGQNFFVYCIRMVRSRAWRQRWACLCACIDVFMLMYMCTDRGKCMHVRVCVIWSFDTKGLCACMKLFIWHVRVQRCDGYRSFVAVCACNEASLRCVRARMYVSIYVHTCIYMQAAPCRILFYLCVCVCFCVYFVFARTRARVLAYFWCKPMYMCVCVCIYIHKNNIHIFEQGAKQGATPTQMFHLSDIESIDRTVYGRTCPFAGVCVCLCMYVCMWYWKHMHDRLWQDMSICRCEYVCVCVCVCIYTYIHTHMYVCMDLMWRA